VTDGAVVEIGSFRGRSTVALAFGARAGRSPPVFAVDPHERFIGVLGGVFTPDDRRRFMQNVVKAGVADIVRLVNLPSVSAARAWNMPIGLLWIDGDHRLLPVLQDFSLWEPWVVIGGWIAFHDSLIREIDVHRVVELAVASGHYVRQAVVGATTVLAKVAAEQEVLA